MRRLWAVARETFVECLRTRVVGVFLALLATCVLATALTMEGDGTLKGRLQTFLSYSTALTQLLLSLVTIFLATGVVTRDIRDKYIFTVATKPLSRWQYVLGRWAGIVGLNALLLVLAAGAIYGLAQYLRGQQTQVEKGKARQVIDANAPDTDRQAVESEIFTARAEHHPEPIDVSDEVKRRFDRLAEEKGIDELIRGRVMRELESQQRSSGREAPIDPRRLDQLLRDAPTRERITDQIQQDLTKQIIDEKQLIKPGGSMRLTFKGLKLPRGITEPLQLRYRLRPINIPESRLLKSRWQIENPQTGLGAYMHRDDSAETVSSFTFSPEFTTYDGKRTPVVSDDGTLTVYYINYPSPDWNTPVKLKPQEVAVLYRVGSFGGNLARATVLALLRLMFLAAAGVLFGVFLSFPVACLACLMALGIGTMSGFIQDATRIPVYTGANPTAWNFFCHYLTEFVFFFLPAFSQTDPGEAIVGGTLIPAADLARESLVMFARPQADSGRLWRYLGFEIHTGAGLRAWACLALGCLIFWRRELAKVQV